MVSAVFKVKVIEEDEKTFYAHKQIKLSGKKVETPIKVANLLVFRENVPLAHYEFIAEVYKGISVEALKRLTNGDHEFQKEFNKKIGSALSKIPSDKMPRVMVPALRVNHVSELSSITEEQIGFLILTQSIFDFYVVPTVERIHLRMGDISEVEHYLRFITQYLELIEEQKLRRAVIGTIPVTLPHVVIPQLLKVYLEHDIRAFALDFSGRVPFSHYQQVGLVQNILHKNEVDAFIYAVNVNPGKPSKKGPSILAQDALSVGFGLDAIGDNHIAFGGGKDGNDNLRIFSKEEYAYHRIEPSSLPKVYPEDTAVPIEVLTQGENASLRKDAQRMFNYEQLGIEAIRIREKVDDGEVTRYVSKKPFVRRYPDKLRLLMNVKEVKPKQSTLDILRGL